MKNILYNIVIWLYGKLDKFIVNDTLNGNAKKSVEILEITRFMLGHWSNLSPEMIYQLLVLIEDRSGNLSTSIIGWRELEDIKDNVLIEARNIVNGVNDNEQS